MLSPELKRYLADLAKRLQSAPHGTRSALMRAASETCACSVKRVYELLRESAGWESGRKTRSDKGETGVSRDTALTVAGLVLRGTRANGRRIRTVKGAVALLEANGKGDKVTEAGEVLMHSPQTIARAMRAFQCHPDQLAVGKPCAPLRSLHPNHVWLLDASLCVLFYLQNGKMGVMESKKFYKNKPWNFARVSSGRVWRYLVVDHCSGCLDLCYVMGAESADNAMSALIRAMLRRAPNDPMHGVPRILYTDKGSGQNNAAFANLCQRLGITQLTHAAGNARATGAVETAQRIVEEGFESRLSCMGVASLEELQSHADTWRIAFNVRAIHTRTGKTRDAVWCSIRPEQLRVPASAEALRELASGMMRERTVRQDLSITFASRAVGGRQSYSLRTLPDISIGEKVRVSVNVWRAPAVDVTKTYPDGTERTYIVQPMQRDDHGFAADAAIIGQEYKRAAETAPEKMLKEVERRAYGTATAVEAEQAKKRGARPFADLDHMADVSAPVSPRFVVRGTAVDLPAPVAQEAPLSHVQACRLLARELGKTWSQNPQAANLWFRAAYPESIPESRVAEVAAAYVKHCANPQPAGMRLLKRA